MLNLQTSGGNLNIGTTAVTIPIVIGNTTSSTGITFKVGSGGINIPSFTTTGALVSNASGLITDASASTAGYVLTSNGAVTAPSFQAAGGGGFTWNNVTGASQAMTVGNGYIANDAALVTCTLPSVAAIGSVVAVQGNVSNGWQIAQNANQYISFNGATSTVGTSGFIASTGTYDAATLICTVTNVGWVVNTSMGTINVN